MISQTGHNSVRFHIVFPMLIISLFLASGVLAQPRWPQVAAGYNHTVGLKADGTVVAVGENSDNQLSAGPFISAAKRYAVQVAAGNRHIVVLEASGQVCAFGNNSFGQCDVDGWNLLK